MENTTNHFGCHACGESVHFDDFNRNAHMCHDCVEVVQLKDEQEDLVDAYARAEQDLADALFGP